jgi:hypothetical protein
MSDNIKYSNFKKSENFNKNLTFKELEKLSIFLTRVFKKNLNFQLKKKFSVEFLDWLYNKNPNGKAIINNAYKNEKIIAHFALVPIRALYDSKTYKSALLVFNAVDENHRNLYLFYKLASKILEIAKSKNIKFVMSVASENSSQLYVKCFQFKLISPLEVKIGLSKFQEKNNLPHKFEIIRNKKMIEWRLNNPRFKYQVYKENNKSLILNDNYKVFKMNMGYINNKELNLINKNIFKNTYNLNPFNMWMGLNNNLKNIKMSFDLPNILKPSPSNFIIKDLKSKKTNLNKEDIKFNLIDYEVF